MPTNTFSTRNQSIHLLAYIQYCSRGLLFVLGYHYINVSFASDEAKRAYESASIPIIIGNHVSLMDPLFIVYRFAPSQISALENKSIPFLGNYLVAMKGIFVNRKDKDSRTTVIKAINIWAERHTVDPLRYSPVAIFPEGTTTSGKQIIQFKKGAFTPGLPVLPIVFKYP